MAPLSAPWWSKSIKYLPSQYFSAGYSLVFKCSVWGECAPSATLKLFSNNTALKTMNLKVKCTTYSCIKANQSKSCKTFKTTYKPFISTSNRNKSNIHSLLQVQIWMSFSIPHLRNQFYRMVCYLLKLII